MKRSTWREVAASGRVALPIALTLAAAAFGLLTVAVRTKPQPGHQPMASTALLIGYVILFLGAVSVVFMWASEYGASRAEADQEAAVQQLIADHTGRLTTMLKLRRAELVNLAVKIEHLRAVSNLTEQDAAGIQTVLASAIHNNDQNNRWPRQREALFWYLLGLATSLALFFAGR